MWQVDSDAYQLWRLQHELGVKRIDRLLNSVTIADLGPPPPASASQIVALLAAVSRRLIRRSYPTHPAAAIVPHSSK